MLRLIQGFFFQNRSWLGTGMQDGDVVGVIKSGLCRFMFSGIIFPDPDTPSALAGVMVDDFGDSVLTQVVILPDSFSFTKKYERRPDLIHYAFRKEGSLWVGGYTGSATGRGGAKCIITEVPKDLFTPPRG